MQDQFTSNGVGGGKHGHGVARQKAPASYQRMYHERALGLLSPKQRKLIEDFFDQDDNQIIRIRSLEPGPARQALAQYGKSLTEVMKHMKKRKTESEKVVISIPMFIWLQPDLSFMEKHLLADIYELQQEPRGCFKGNRAFAVELGTTEGNIKDMLWRLKSSRFLHEQPGEEGKRSLMLSKHFLELVGQCAPTDPSVATDAEGSAHLPSRQSPLTKASVPTDAEQEPEPDETRMDVDDSADGDSPRLQGTSKLNQQQPEAEAAARGVVVDDLKVRGAAAPCNPRRGASPPATPNAPAGKGRSQKKSQGASQPGKRPSISSVSSDCPESSRQPESAHALPAQPAEARIDSPAIRDGAGKSPADTAAADPAMATNRPANEAHKLLQVFVREYPRYFAKSYKLQPQDKETAIRYFQDHPEDTALVVANYLLRAWYLSFQQDGKFAFGCCKQSKRVAGFFKWLERDDGRDGIVENVENRFICYRKCAEEKLLKSLRKGCRDYGTIDQVFADDLRRVRQSKQAEAEAEAKRRAEAEQLREQAEKQAEAAREARAKQPSADDRASAFLTLSHLYDTALGIRIWRFVTQRAFDFTLQVLGFNPPALREWYEQYGSRRIAPAGAEIDLPDQLRTRLKREYHELPSAVGDFASMSAGVPEEQQPKPNKRGEAQTQ